MNRGGSAFRAAVLAAGLALAPAPAAGQVPIRAEAEAVLEASPAEVRAVLLDLEGFARWFPTLVEWRVLSRGEREARVYGRQDFPWPAGDRDYVARYRWWSEGDVFLLEATGESGAEPASPPDVVRLERFRSKWRVAPHASGGTLARYTAEGPVSGRLARWLASIAWRRETGRVMEGLARALREADGRGIPMRPRARPTGRPASRPGAVAEPRRRRRRGQAGVGP